MGIQKYNNAYSFLRTKNQSQKTAFQYYPVCSLKTGTIMVKRERFRHLGVWQVERRARLRCCYALMLLGWQSGTLGASLPSEHGIAFWLYPPSDGHQASTEQALASGHPKWLIVSGRSCMWNTLSTAVNLCLSSFTALCWWVICFSKYWAKKKTTTQNKTKKPSSLLVLLCNIYV